MPWFQNLCRQAGLAVHRVVHPEPGAVQKRELNRKVEQQQVSPTVTLRRTTIEEVEVRAADPPPGPGPPPR